MLQSVIIVYSDKGYIYSIGFNVKWKNLEGVGVDLGVGGCGVKISTTPRLTPSHRKLFWIYQQKKHSSMTNEIREEASREQVSRQQVSRDQLSLGRNCCWGASSRGALFMESADWFGTYWQGTVFNPWRHQTWNDPEQAANRCSCWIICARAFDFILSVYILGYAVRSVRTNKT